MALPTAYLTSTKNVDAILNSLHGAQAPQKLTYSFLGDLGFKSSSDRLIVAVLKALGFLTPDGSPTERYFRWLNQTESEKVMAEALHAAYTDLFQLNKNAQTLTKTDIKNKFKTLTQGKVSDSVLDKMSNTFLAFAKHADFSAASGPSGGDEGGEDDVDGVDEPPKERLGSPLPLGGLVYNIQIALPESRDQAVYDALFRSLKAHLFE